MKVFVMFFFLLIFQTNSTKEACDSLIVSGVEAMHSKDYAKSLALLSQARAIAEENNLNKQLFLSINNIGANYYSLLDYGEALDNYLEAYTIAIKELDSNHEMIVLNNIAILYSKEKKFDKAEEYFKKAYSIAKENTELKKIGLYAINLGIVANEKGDLNSGKQFLDEAILLLKNEPKMLIQAHIALIENLYRRKEYSQARTNALNLLPKLEKDAAVDEEFELQLLLSKIYSKEGNLNLAIAYAEKAQKKNSNLENKVIVYEQLAQLYFLSKNYQLAFTAKDSVIKATEQWNQIKNGRQFETNRVKFEIKNYQNEILKNQQKLKTERKAFYTIITISVLIIFLIGWALRNSYIKNKQRRILQVRNKEILELELEKEKSENLILEKQLNEKETLALLEQERLKNEIDTRNRKLSAKALYLSERNNLISSIINDLSASAKTDDNSLLKEHIKNLKNLIKKEEEWESFTQHFEEVNQGFLNALKKEHSNLNSNDLRFISYLYMNLSSKEIASILNITPEACRKRKERIAKKMDQTDGSQLYSYLSKF